MLITYALYPSSARDQTPVTAGPYRTRVGSILAISSSSTIVTTYVMAAVRTPYEAGTPDTPTFPPDAQNLRASRASFAEAEAVLESPKRGLRWAQSVRHRFIGKAREVVQENTGMLLVAASGVCTSLQR